MTYSTFLRFTLLVALQVLPAQTAFAGKLELAEQEERKVDRAAVTAQDSAIDKLALLLKKYAGTGQEPTLLLKMAEFQQEKASILFRITLGDSKNGSVKNAAPHVATKQAIQALSTLITKYPRNPEIAHALYLRGKSHEELGDKKAASRDYLSVVTQYPQADDISRATMALAEFAIAENRHEEAIRLLSQVEKRSEDPHFPFALYKLAWSHYNLKNIPAALSFLERHIGFYDARIEASRAEKKESGALEEGVLATSDLALRENSLLDLPVFYFEGYEQGRAQQQFSDALAYFRRMESGPFLGRMTVRFAKLLRSHGHEKDLFEWKKQVLEKERNRPESVDVLLTVYEYALNHRRYDQLIAMSRDLVELKETHFKAPSFERARKMLLETAQGLQEQIVKNKDANDIRDYSKTLVSLYDSFIELVDKKDPRVPRVHYNLAETLFAIRDYSGATRHYRWIVEFYPSAPNRPTDLANAGVKAIAARYEVLNEQKLVPQDLKALPFSSDKARAGDPLLEEWVSWIEAEPREGDVSADREKFDFEAGRALYASGQIRRATDRFLKLALEKPSSTFAIPSATLVMDTSIETADWKATEDLARRLAEVRAWKDGPFADRLAQVAADAAYKQLEAQAKLAGTSDELGSGTLDSADRFLKKYPKSPRISDCLVLAGNLALRIKARIRALDYFNRLITQAGDGKASKTAFIAKATLEEEQYRFAQAATDYFKAATLESDSKTMDPVLKRKILALSWLSGDEAALKSRLAHPGFCADASADDCALYLALSALQTGSISPTEAFEKARKGAGSHRAVWAVIALEDARKFGFRDRLVLIRSLGNSWDNLDPVVKFTLLPRVMKSVAQAFAMNRASIDSVAPLRANERHITHRVDVIKEMENGATAAMKLPWIKLRAQVLGELATAYADFAAGLRALDAPAELSGADLATYQETIAKLSKPFAEKSREMSIKSEEMLKVHPSVRIDRALSAEEMDKLDPKGRWLAAAGREPANAVDALEKPAEAVRTLWMRAMKAQKWAQAAFFLQEAQEKQVFTDGVLGSMKAITLATAGAKEEALLQLEESVKNLEPEGQAYLLAATPAH